MNPWIPFLLFLFIAAWGYAAFREVFKQIERKEKSRIKIGLDIHGVIDAVPEVFGPITKAMVRAGHEVHVLTGAHWGPDIEAELKGYGIVWTHSFSIADHHRAVGTTMTYIKANNPMIDAEMWDRTKGDYCERQGIHLHLDDTTIYGDYFKTPFARVWTKNNKPKAAHKDTRHLT